MIRACRAWLIRSVAMSLSAAHMSCLTCLALPARAHLLQAVATSFAEPFPPLFGQCSARLSSSIRRPASKANCWQAFTSSTPIILTASNQSLLHHFFLHPRDTLVRLHFPHSALTPAAPILGHSIRPHSAHSNASSTQLCAASAALSLPGRGSTTTPLSTWRTQPTRIFSPICEQHR